MISTNKKLLRLLIKNFPLMIYHHSQNTCIIPRPGLGTQTHETLLMLKCSKDLGHAHAIDNMMYGDKRFASLDRDCDFASVSSLTVVFECLAVFSQ